jgi:hypothetical protein
MPVTIIDPLLCLPGKEPELLPHWDGLIDLLQEKKGFVSAQLMSAVQSAGVVQLGPFTHVSLVTFACGSSYCRAIGDKHVVTSVDRLRTACLLHPGVFEPVRHIPSAEFGRVATSAGF